MIVSTTSGRVRGRKRDGSYYFGAIPYAGASRFEKPQPVEPFSDIFDATALGTVFPQPPSRLERIMGPPLPDPEQSEDSFTVTVTTPSLTGIRPVMVWLHGGGYSSGGGSLPWYDGDALSSEGDVVVVSVNYRVGVLGYLFLDGVSEGNLGVHDQIAALEWVRENIEEFGGNPNSITVFGQSAGAHSIVNLLSSNNSHPLFHRAILQSTPRVDLNFTQAAAIENGETFARLLDEDPRTAPLSRVLDAFRSTALEFSRRSPNVVQPPFAPIAELAPVTQTFEAAPDVIVGYTRDEGSAFLRDVAGATDPERVAEKALTQNMFAEPAMELADAFTATGASVYTYRFDWTPTDDVFGATHCAELPFVLGTEQSWQASPMLGSSNWPSIDALGRRMRRHWASFAHTGSPDSSETWEKYTSAQPIGITFS
ncbi:carboxylesterase family protein [Rhodococcus sp. NPDC056743]|uniref:carboxylesterase family protein n=1 Tax=Rhodococcus sp. NPDC056743 TaxID=3345934 RepID=UPI003670B335